MAILTIGVSSRALFHIEDGNAVFEEHGQTAFDEYMRSKEDVPLRPGAAFSLVRKLLDLNSQSTVVTAVRDRVEVVMLSRNSPDAGLRIMNSIRHYRLPIERAVFSSGGNRFKYAKHFGAQLFLSANSPDVANALEKGMAAATIMPKAQAGCFGSDPVVRIAFDGDAVLFSDEADKMFRRLGMDEYRTHEEAQAHVPLGPGPMKGLLEALTKLQQDLGEGDPRLRIALVTARGMPAHARPLKTLRSWGLRVDDAVFAGGAAKRPPPDRVWGGHLL